MLLALGSERMDITYRALVVGVVELAGDLREVARRLEDEGADLLEIDCRSVGAQGVASVEDAVATLRSVSRLPVAIRTPSAQLRSVAASEGAVALDDLRAPVIEAESDDPDEVLAEQVLAIAGGARIVRTRDVRSARRVASVMARLLEARASEGAATS